LEGVKAALKSGANVNTKNEYGNIGLIEAVFNNHNSVVDLLLNTPNIDVNQKDNHHGMCALHFALENWENNEAVKLLLNAPSIDVNIVDNGGYNPVHQAVLYGDNIEGLKLLLSHPSLTALTINQKDNNYGYTPVMWAVRKNRLKHVEVLAADPRVDLDTNDNEGGSLEELARDPETQKSLGRSKPETRGEEKVEQVDKEAAETGVEGFAGRPLRP